MYLLLFIFGSAVGSFLNVVALRYRPDKFLVGKAIGGRSYCPGCGAQLRWFELIPVVSFVLQRGHCRHCGVRISIQYPIVEILSGLIFVFVPSVLSSPYLPPATYHLQSGAWILIFITLLLVALIDLRLNIIPDEANIFLVVLGIALILLMGFNFGIEGGSFLGSYAPIFGFRSNIWLNHAVAAAFGGIIFGLLILATRGRGMGMGDLKFAVPLGLIFGWPDILLIIGIAFIIGALVGGYAMIIRGKTLKSALPFGPFLSLSAAIIFFFGQEIANFYFNLLIP